MKNLPDNIIPWEDKDLNKLPVIYRLIEPMPMGEGIPVAFIESDFHQSKALGSRPFYKPISKMNFK